MEQENFLVLGEAWGYYPSTTEHLLKRLVAKNKFLWVDAIGCRAPEWNLYTLQRLWGKLSQQSPNSVGSSENDGVMAYTPPVVPLRPTRAVRWWNRSAMRRGINQRLKELGMECPILLATSPMAAEVIDDIPAKLVVYYILDNYEEMPHHYTGYIRELEAQMIDRADVLLATSEPLVEQKSKPGRPITLLPQGVDFDHFHRSFAQRFPEPVDLADIPGRRILFVGLLAPWVDVELIASAAKAYPSASVVVIGPVRINIESLRKEPNVYVLGSRPYADIPLYLAHCNAAIIPFLENTLTRYVNPLKLLEYMAAGLPVISTPLPHAPALDDLVQWASSASEFITQLGLALNGFSEARRARCIEYAQENSWESRARQFSDLLEESQRRVVPQSERGPALSRRER